MIFNLQDGKIEGMEVPYDNIRHVDLSVSGAVVARLSLPPQCYESLQVTPNNALVGMKITIAPKDVERFGQVLTTRGMVRCHALTDFYLTLPRLIGSNWMGCQLNRRPSKYQLATCQLDLNVRVASA